MANNVTIEMRGNDAQILRAWLEVMRGVRRLAAELDRIARQRAEKRSA